jgi:hypothetical protein
MNDVTVKGSVVRSWARCAQRQGVLAQVEHRLLPSTLAMLRDPPLASSWVSADALRLLRLLGTSPSSLFARMNDYSKQAMKGAELCGAQTVIALA